MNVRYFFSSPDGDIPLDEGLLSRPFMMNPMEEHPHLKLGDYFKTIEQFVTGENGAELVRILGNVRQEPVSCSDITAIVIRSEKHGGLYHLSSVEILAPDLQQKFVVSTAVTESSRQWLQREYQALRLLTDSFQLPYIPEVFLLRELELQTAGAPARLLMMLGQWFEDYHEWHLHRGVAGEPEVVVWDFKKGYRRAGDREVHQIYEQAALILTLYYNVRSTHQIFPWLHAAGDFVVKSTGDTVDVRLTTVRGYEPLMVFLEEQDINPLMALITFFLNLTIRTRLDRWEGVGEVAWAPDSVVQPTVQGFLRALASMEKEGRYETGGMGAFASLLKTFGKEELLRLCQPLLGFYRQESRETAFLVEERLDRHCTALRSVIQALPG